MAISQRGILLIAFALSSCKAPKSVAKLDSQGEQAATLAISDTLPEGLENFVEVLAGKSKRMHNQYFTSILPGAIKSKARMTSLVNIQYTEEISTERGKIPAKREDVYQGVVFEDRVFVFKRKYGTGGAAESGPWWYPVKSYPMTLLGDKSAEEKMRHALNTEIYEKMELGRMMSEIDSLEFGLSFIPAYAGAKDYFYDGKTSGLVWMIGDVASLGMAAKLKAVANTSRAIVIAASAVRIGGGAVKASKGDATFGTGVDVALATLEGTIASIGFINIKFKLNGGLKAKSVDEIVENLAEGQKVFLADRESAELIARKLGRNVDDVSRMGLSAQELAKVANRKVKPGASAANALENAALKIPRRTEQIRDDSIGQLLSQPYRGKILDTEIAAIQKKITQGNFPTPLEVQNLLTVATPNKPTAFVNVTENSTVKQVLDADGLYWGYIGYPGLPKGAYQNEHF
ncbi:MAG: hypothetical protein NTV34_18615 [Proteobacteria bacterium]|nr:hypothetical protein [Pseudomonadota bacterium]